MFWRLCTGIGAIKQVRANHKLPIWQTSVARSPTYLSLNKQIQTMVLAVVGNGIYRSGCCRWNVEKSVLPLIQNPNYQYVIYKNEIINYGTYHWVIPPQYFLQINLRCQFSQEPTKDSRHLVRFPASQQVGWGTPCWNRNLIAPKVPFAPLWILIEGPHSMSGFEY